MTKQRNKGRWTDDEHAHFLEGLERWPTKPSKIAEHIVTRDVTQVNNYKARYKKQEEEEPAAAAETTASAVQPATPPRTRATDAPPAAPPSEETLRPPPSATREDQDGVEEFKEETPAETSAAPAREETPHEEDHDVEVRQDASSVVTSDTAQSSQSGDSATFVLAVMNTKGGGRKDEKGKFLSARSKEENKGVTQKESVFFQKLMALFLSYIKGQERFGSLPAAWLVTEVAWALGQGNMSALSQRAPDAARSGKGIVKNLEAAVIWGARYAEGAEALTLGLLSLNRGTGEYYVQVAGKSLQVDIQVDTQKDFKAGEYEEMLSRVAAAQLTLVPVGQCLLLSYHGPHIITGPGTPEEKFRKKCRYLRWLLLLARQLSDLLGIPVVLGGDLNLVVKKKKVREELGDAAKDAELVEYKFNPRREENVVDWFYLINPRDGRTRLVCDSCVAIDPAKPYREELAAEEGVTLNENWFDHDALLAVLRLVVVYELEPSERSEPF